MTRRPLPRDRRIVRCPAGCGGWVHVDTVECRHANLKEKPK